MKHTTTVTLWLVVIFFMTQLMGLATVNKYIEVEVINDTTSISHGELALIGQPPEVENKELQWIPIIIAVLIGTAILFLLIKFRLRNVWKYWFLVVVWMVLTVSFDVYMIWQVAVVLAAFFALMKVFKNNMVIHNLTEIFMYAGLALILINFLNIISASILLVAISLYDAYAVWKSKHMIKLAEFQSESKLFAGLSIPYQRQKINDGGKKSKVETAILGGGDMGFPLIFSAAVMEHLIIVKQLPKLTALFQTLVIPVIVSMALFLLLYKGKKDTFYPAMPFLSMGCFLGYGLILLL
ncbi:MAG TPA: presenilin family intramembrane aspartyl protease [Candidatus Nanoarchaeia archaeon]|nr:presenilin family intramembrane aspartyl protease [Candidatus Nanoarchaeia archaeon]